MRRARDRGEAWHLEISVPGRRKFLVGGRPRRGFLAACVAAVACLRTGLVLPFTCLRSCLARGSCLGRGLWTRRNFPDVWYKSKKKEISLYHRTCLDVLPLCCSRLTRSSNRCTRFGGWAGSNAPDDSVWKSPQVMTHLVEQACWMEEAWTCPERNSLLSRLDELCESPFRCHFGFKA